MTVSNLMPGARRGHVQQVFSMQMSGSGCAGSAEWNSMIQDMVVSCAGLVQYLADQWPPELQEGWLQY